MLKATKALNQKYANANMEVRKIRAAGGNSKCVNSLDIALPRRLSAKMNLTLGDYVTVELQRLPRSGAQCFVIRKLDFNGIVGEAIEQ